MTRENAILCLKGIKNYGRDTFTEQSDWQESLDMAIDALKTEPKHGRWTTEHLCTTAGGTYPIERCSECECASVVGRTNYCPNCGAKMDGGENG